MKLMEILKMMDVKEDYQLWCASFFGKKIHNQKQV